MNYQAHVSVYGMREKISLYRLTREEPSSLKNAFTLALREVCVVTSSLEKIILLDTCPSGP